MSKRIWSGILTVLSCLVEWNEIATDYLADWLSRFARRISLAAVLVVGGGVTYKLATASRNSSGTMSAINGPYAAPNVISSSAINARFSDIESEITDSLDRSGKGPMLAPMRLTNGTNAAPSLTFDSETTAGLYRVSSGILAMTFNGTESSRWTTNGIRAANGAVATPSLSFLNDTGSGLYRIGASDIGFAINGVKVQEWNADTTTTKVGDKLSLWGSTPTIGFNLYNNGSNRYMTTNLAGALTLDTTNGFIFYSAPSGTADAVATLTERMRVNTSGVTIGSGGTAMALMKKGSASITPGSITANTCTTVTSPAVTGATGSSQCLAFGPLTSGMTTNCQGNVDSCDIQVCNVRTINGSPTAGTYGCWIIN
jgi:hypothetical protein